MASIDAWRDVWRRPLGAPRQPTQALDQAPKPRPMLRSAKLRRDGSVAGHPVWPHAEIEEAYARKIGALVDEIARSLEHWLSAAYRRNEPAIAQDATPAAELQRAIDDLARRWQRRFDVSAEELARWFATKVENRSSAQLRSILRAGGWSVRFQMTPAMRDVLRATVEENVALIKSIPQKYHLEVQGAVMRSVQAGRDLHVLTKELRHFHGVTRKRAEFIARDQNNKSSAMLSRARQLEVGIERGLWLHSHAGITPRPTHLANDGKVFDLRMGWYDPAVKKRVFPGELINCRCAWRPLVRGFS